MEVGLEDKDFTEDLMSEAGFEEQYREERRLSIRRLFLDDTGAVGRRTDNRKFKTYGELDASLS